MTSRFSKFARKMGMNLRNLGLTSLHSGEKDEIWHNLSMLSQTMGGCMGGKEAVAYYQELATRETKLRPLISEAAERFLAVYRPAIMLPAPQDGVIVDIGAGCGLFAVLAALLHGSKRIWAFEPDPELFEIARQAIDALNISNVELINMAVVPEDWPDTHNYLRVLPDTVFRSLHAKGEIEIRMSKVADLPMGASTPIAILKLIAPGMFSHLAAELSERTTVLVGEVGRMDYTSKDHAELSPLLNKVPLGCIRDAESGLLYKTNATQRLTRARAPWAPAIRRVRADPQISVIIPTYNIGELIETCVESIVKSIDQPTEILVINDGSTQIETLRSLKQVAKMTHTRVIDKPNGGCASARNLGLQIAQGAFLTLIDGDDFVEESFLPLLCEAIHVEASNIAEIGFSDYNHATGEISDNVEPYIQKALNPGLIGYEADMWKLLRRQPAIWRRLYRTEWLRQNNLYFPEHIKAYDDLEFQFISLYLNGGVAYANTRGYYYRKNRSDQDVEASDARHFGTFQMLVKIENFLRNRRAPREHFMLFDLFALDCLTWSYSLLQPQLREPFLRASQTFFLGGKAFDRAVNVHREICKQASRIADGLAKDFCIALPDRKALEIFHRTAGNYADHIYDYHYPLEVSG